MEEKKLLLKFYGLTVEVLCPAWLHGILEREFLYFLSGEARSRDRCDIVIRAVPEPPPYGTVPPVRATLYHPESISYDAGEVRYVDYYGKALGVYDYRADRGELYSADRDLLHELTYLMIHSRVGERLDGRGMHRVHALGIEAAGRGVLCLLPQGGGKTTLFLGLLKRGDIRFLSDDTPLVDRNGVLHPFPLRIGVSGDVPADIPERFLSRFNRRKHGTKTLIDIACLEGRVAPAVPARAVLVGERVFSPEARIVSAGRSTAAAALFRNCIAGLGLPQVVEYFLRTDPLSLFRKAHIAASRTAACARLLLRARAYRFVIGTDTRRNAEAFSAFLDRLGRE